MGRTEALIASHAFFFVAGVACGKLYDRDELNSYRSAYEKPMERFRRYAGNAVLGAAGLTVVLALAKVTTIATRKAT
ncbi:hypothetical protein IV203_026193 [Nitzschia inconspicua]|uniref:Uncharacterized protein n=1 Tax=Nitzschia inconspicua TaxID=303405 RepID=A0A9K3PX08_9STRA|nr:hypothetical protein IV203_026193 [Nitzschia inconspicua]